TARLARCSSKRVFGFGRMALLNPPIDRPYIADRDGADDQREHVGRGRGNADVERRRKPLLVRIPGGDPGGVARSTLGDRQHLLEHRERERGAQHEYHHDEWDEQWQRDVPEARERTGAVEV